MPSANKTSNIGLNQWLGNEYVKRQDFVDDNRIIDEEIGKIKENIENISTDAKGTSFDNSDNGMTATNVQDAIEENKTSILNLESSKSDITHKHDYQKHKLTMDNGRTSTYQGDFNSLIETGFYYTHTFSNGPVPTGTGVYVEVIKHQDSYILQRVTIPSSAGDIAIWSRIMYNGSWKSWTKLIDKVVGATLISLEEQVLSLEENNINMQDKISILTEENEILKQELALTQDAVNEMLFMMMNMEVK